ncbi:hypothetical protein F383_36056 [Gossypium arboreum]|uniref:Uncharacterized protein n=1 Tax=Gossypium arboreum TaxID=29729 RepID=A0A0B0NCY4_GOSAR|nr:hypothetical protein F383_36056 [Gossypium arboreum]
MRHYKCHLTVTVSNLFR